MTKHEIIRETLYALEDIWNNVSDARLGQLIANEFTDHYELSHIENEEFIKRLKQAYGSVNE